MRKRSKNFGEISVELDAIEPAELRRMVQAAIEDHLPSERLKVLQAAEQSERELIGNLVRFGRCRGPVTELVAKMGIFAAWQPQYAARGIVTSPVDGDRKAPAVKGPDRFGMGASAKLVAVFRGKRTRLYCRGAQQHHRT
jgi:hypothetical protein